MEIDKDLKRKWDGGNAFPREGGEKKGPRREAPVNYEKLRAEWKKFSEDRAKAKGEEDDEYTYDLVLAEDLKGAADRQAAKKTSSSETGEASKGKPHAEPWEFEGFEPFDPKAQEELYTEFEEWRQSNEPGNVLLREAEEKYDGGTLDLSDGQFGKLLAGKGDVVASAIFDTSGSLLRPSDAATMTNTAAALKPLRFHFLDVGQGNGTLIECPHGELILIDYGTSKGEKVTAEPTAEFIRSKGAKLNYLIISHSDKDHVKLVRKLTGVKLDKVLCGGKAEHYSGGEANKFVYYLSDEHKIEFVDTLINGGKPYTEAPDSDRSTRKIQCKDVDICIVSANAPPETYDHIKLLRPEPQRSDKAETITGTDPNASSVVLSIRYGGKQVLICADATFDTDYCILRSEACRGWRTQLKSYGLSGGHHGSKFSFSEEFLQKVDPEWVHFSADMVKTFMHPNWKLIKRVLKECPLLKESPAYGPHGIVYGQQYQMDSNRQAQYDEMLDEDLNRLALYDQDLVALRQIKKRLQEAFPKETIGWKETLFWSGVQVIIDQHTRVQARESETDSVSSSGSAAPDTDLPLDSPWFRPVMAEIALTIAQAASLTSNEDILKLAVATSTDHLTYWAGEYARMETEQVSLEKTQAALLATETDYWHWNMTELNLFTTLETADSGVYWVLEIDADGNPFTFRT